MPTHLSVGIVEARIEPDLQQAMLEVIDRVCGYTGKEGDKGLRSKSGYGAKLSGLAAFRGSGQHYRLPGTRVHNAKWTTHLIGERQSARRPMSSPIGKPMLPNAEVRELQLPEIAESNLPDEATLRSWNQQSQQAYWNQREFYWSRLVWTAAETEEACRVRKLFPGLGGGLGDAIHVPKAYLKDRLIRYDFCPSQLTPAELCTKEAAVIRHSAAQADGIHPVRFLSYFPRFPAFLFDISLMLARSLDSHCRSTPTL